MTDTPRGVDFPVTNVEATNRLLLLVEQKFGVSIKWVTPNTSIQEVVRVMDDIYAVLDTLPDHPEPDAHP